MMNLRMRPVSYAILLTTLIPVGRSSAAGFDLYIDLAAQPSGITVKRPISLREETSVSVVVLNLDPAATYTVYVSLDNAELPAISIDPGNSLDAFLGGLYSDPSAKGGGSAPSTPENPEWNEEDESLAIPARPGRNASGKGAEYRLPDVAVMRPGQDLKVQIVRGGEEGQSGIVWTTIFDAGSRGSWNISLGFGIPILVDGHRRYGMRHDSVESYRIVSLQDDERFELIPAAFFHWVPSANELSDWSWSVIGGLGLNFDSPVLFLGGALTYNRNITLSAGGVAHQVKRLNPKYIIGDVLPIELDEEQLHAFYYRINPYVSVTFQLSSNLFGG